MIRKGSQPTESGAHEDDDAVWIAEPALPALTRAVRRLGIGLDYHGVASTDWENALRTLFHLTTLGGYRLIAVAGSQGVGKTTFVRGLYPGSDAWLRPNPGRGERHPIAVVETAGRTTTRAVIVRRTPGSDNLSSLTLDHPDDRWRDALAGKDGQVLMIRLEVPLAFWKADRAGFVLLPGFERRDAAPWQDLMRVVLATSPAAVVVTGSQRLGNAEQRQIVDDLHAGAGGPIPVAVALNVWAGQSGDDVTTLISRAAEVYGVEQDRVMTFGVPPALSPKTWLPSCRAALDRIRPHAGYARRSETGLLRELVRDRLREIIRTADGVLDRSLLETGPASELTTVMGIFDRSAASLLATLDATLRTEFDERYRAAAADLDRELARTGGLPEVAQRVEDWLTVQPYAARTRLAQLVLAAWDAEAAIKTAESALAETARIERLKLSGGDTPLTARTLRLLVDVGSDGIGAAGTYAALEAAPMVALEARAFALTMADVEGAIRVPASGIPDTALTRVSPEQRHALGGLAILTGAPPDLDPNLPTMLAHALTVLLTSDGAAPDAAGSAAPATVAAAGGAGTAATRVVGPALTAAAIGFAAAATIESANQRMRERDDNARYLLSRHRVAVVELTRDAVAELLRQVRDVIEARMRHALHISEHTERQLGLQQAIRTVEYERGRMLEVLDAGHVV